VWANKCHAVLTGLGASVLAVLSAAASAQPPAMPLGIEGNARAGESLVTTCYGCHGIPGYRNAYPSFRVPKLGGQNGDYIEIALQNYRRGTRPHPTMGAQAAVLGDRDIADVAAYLTSIEGAPERGISEAAASQIETGRSKSTVCAACHGETGIAVQPQWPTLAGQHASYLEHALTEYQNGKRQDPVMGPLVASLTAQDVADLAAYFAAQQGLYTTLP
jgi:cytochrome c553